jgi:hypothetical protein
LIIASQVVQTNSQVIDSKLSAPILCERHGSGVSGRGQGSEYRCETVVTFAF